MCGRSASGSYRWCPYVPRKLQSCIEFPFSLYRFLLPLTGEVLLFCTAQGGVHFSEGPYDRIAVKVFNTLDVDTFYVRYKIFTVNNFVTLK